MSLKSAILVEPADLASDSLPLAMACRPERVGLIWGAARWGAGGNVRSDLWDYGAPASEVALRIRNEWEASSARPVSLSSTNTFNT